MTTPVEPTSNSEATTPITFFTSTNELKDSTELSKTEPTFELASSLSATITTETNSFGQQISTIEPSTPVSSLFSTDYSTVKTVLTTFEAPTTELTSTNLIMQSTSSTFIEIDTTIANEDKTDTTDINSFITSDTRPITTKDLTSTEIVLTTVASITKLFTLEGFKTSSMMTFLNTEAFTTTSNQLLFTRTYSTSTIIESSSTIQIDTISELFQTENTIETSNTYSSTFWTSNEISGMRETFSTKYDTSTQFATLKGEMLFFYILYSVKFNSFFKY